MTTIKNWALTLLKSFHALKDENLLWENNNQEQSMRLKHARILAAKALEAQLKKKRVLLEHELTLLRTNNDAKVAMLKTKCKQDIKDYKEYLTSLETLKHSIQTSFDHLPDAVAFTIHHHAKQLLNQMWETDDFENKIHNELHLIKFMTTVHEDTRRHLEEGTSNDSLPEKTLRLIQNKPSF
jgi:hypothetical protein